METFVLPSHFYFNNFIEFLLLVFFDRIMSNEKLGNAEEKRNTPASNNLPFRDDQAEHKGKIKMLIRRVGDDCYVIQSTLPANSAQDNNCLQSPSAEAVLDEVEDKLKLSQRSANGAAHDALSNNQHSKSRSPVLLDSGSSSCKRSPSPKMMEYAESAENKEMNKNPMRENANTILTLLNLLDYCIHNDVTVNDVCSKILEDVLNLLRGKDNVECNL
ncbi:hypothetical protein T4B_8138 [Trichinella pseudospiralis]|uniref:Uncharacterized protein n=1 Tax=Trichinella pseudospiralis TaxID=6337 RepID=A0A0V1I9Q7_TRIPS|nr:hypothetical protein T4B_8138 [Trichinella pseudospiralis]